MTEVRELEFIATVGSGIDFKWTESNNVNISIARFGPITDATIKAICITLRRKPSSTQGQSQESCGSSRAWAYVENAQGDTKSISFRSFNQNEKDSEPRGNLDVIKKVQQKITDLWRGKLDETKANLDSWLKAPNKFFGDLDRSSTEKWSFDSIKLLEDKHPGRSPFHKLNLALHLKRRIREESCGGYFVEANCRKAMMIECCPRYNTLEKKAQETVRRQYDRIMEQGDVLRSIWNISAGLLLIVAPLLTRDDLRAVKRHIDDFSRLWLPTEAKESAKEYNILAVVILRYAHETVKPPNYHRLSIMDGSSAEALSSQDHVHSTDISSALLPEIFIPTILHAMGGRIPKVMIISAISPQQRRSENGEIYEIQLHSAGIHQDLRTVLSDSSNLMQGIEMLTLLSTIQVETSSGGTEDYVCLSESAQVSYQQDRPYWIHQAFELWCYTFPRKFGAEQRVNRAETRFLSILQHLLRQFSEANLEIPSNTNTVEALLAAARTEKLSIKRQLLALAARVQKDLDQAYLQAEIVYQQSVLLRFEGNAWESGCLIKDFCNRPYLKEKPKSHPILGLLCLSQTNNLVYDFQFSPAHEELQNWQLPTTNPSQWQSDILWEQVFCAGRIFRGEGHFEKAQQCFESCLSTAQLPKTKRIHIAATLADLYCELDYQCERNLLPPEVEYLAKAKTVIEPEILRLRTHGRRSKGFRRLLLSSIEIEIKHGRYSEAESLTKELLENYDEVLEPDIIDRLGHVRALIASARISSLIQAEERWEAALRQNANYNPLEGEVFTCAIIYLFISLTRFQVQRFDESWDSFSHAKEILGRRKRQFLIPGVGTYLFDFVRDELQSLAGYQIVEEVME